MLIPNQLFLWSFRVSLPGDMDSCTTAGQQLDKHSFPPCRYGKSRVLSIQVESLPRMEKAPPVACQLCSPTSSGGVQTLGDSPEEGHAVLTERSRVDSLIRLMPISLPPVPPAPPAGTSRENPLFNEQSPALDSLDNQLCQLRLRASGASGSAQNAVQFFIGDAGALNIPGEPFLVHNVLKSRGLQGTQSYQPPAQTSLSLQQRPLLARGANGSLPKRSSSATS